MNAKDLRIGNRLNILDKENLVEVVIEEVYKSAVTASQMPVEYRLLKPIALEETLIKKYYTFTEDSRPDGSVYIYNNGKLNLKFYQKGPLIGSCERISIGNCLINTSVCKYLHQLQNVYFVLTGIELELVQKNFY